MTGHYFQRQSAVCYHWRGTLKRVHAMLAVFSTNEATIGRYASTLAMS